jgi:hypothetical protein
VRDHLKDLTKQYDKSENDLKALQSVGQVHHFFSDTLFILKFYVNFMDLIFLDCW